MKGPPCAPIAARAISELLVTRYLSFRAATIMDGVSNGPISSNAGLLIAKCLGLFPQLWSDQAVQPPLVQVGNGFRGLGLWSQVSLSLWE